MIAILSGCYVPGSFDAEVEIGRTGFYKIKFEGYMAETNLFNKVVRDKISAREEKERVERLKTDLMRDTATKLFEYFKKGHFRIKWEKQGDILKSKTVIFLRRNEYILGMSYNRKTGRVGMQGRSLKKDTRNKLAEIGLGGTNGEIRVITDLPMIASNATKVAKNRKRGPGFKTYTLEDQEHLRADPKPHSGASVESTLAK